MTTFGLLLVAFLMTAPGCQSIHVSNHNEAGFPGVTKAIAVMMPTDGNAVHGTVRFVDQGSQVLVVADIYGLSAGGTHAWHVHEWGNITDPAGKATGGHYNPDGHAHGLPGNDARHAGDFGNLMADSSGHAYLELAVDNLTLAGGRNPVVGRGLIIHADPDDGGQPTGNAGARIAQGVIGIDRP